MRHLAVRLRLLIKPRCHNHRQDGDDDEANWLPTVVGNSRGAPVAKAEGPSLVSVDSGDRLSHAADEATVQLPEICWDENLLGWKFVCQQ